MVRNIPITITDIRILWNRVIGDLVSKKETKQESWATCIAKITARCTLGLLVKACKSFILNINFTVHHHSLLCRALYQLGHNYSKTARLSVRRHTLARVKMTQATIMRSSLSSLEDSLMILVSLWWLSSPRTSKGNIQRGRQMWVDSEICYFQPISCLSQKIPVRYSQGLRGRFGKGLL